MVEGDEDKTAFFAGEGVFCYSKMPFGLKYAGAMYQRLVDKVFSKQIRRNLEAYVDDIVIKTESEEVLIWCEGRPILGHLITKQGIKANPLKIKAVTELEQPQALKDIQSLNEKLATLSRFLSNGAERSLPFFKILKSCNGKKKIHLTDEADKAFNEIKKFVQAFPMLTAPRAWETLIMYLAASKESINAIRSSARSVSYSASLLVVSNSKRRGISGRKSNGVSFSSLFRNTISCSPNSIGHLATFPVFSGPVSACLIGVPVRTIIV
nr:reverse transcriptase domain-containing protein [Tanacetum cinerariifolium]